MSENRKVDQTVKLKDEVAGFLTRDQGEALCSRLVTAHDNLGQDDLLVIDFEGVTAMTPSFADECLGKLAERVGSSRFRSTVRLIGASEPVRILVNSILSRRLEVASDAGERD